MSSGKSSQPAPPPPAPNPTVQAQALVDAQIAAMPRAAQLQYDINANPNYGIQATTQLQETARQNVFPQETQVRNQLALNILQQLLSPTGITSDQQGAINTRRQDSQSQLQTALRERSNLGGGLYGGRSMQEEGRLVGELQNAFAEEDIGRQERARLNAIQSALPLLQMLYPNVGITNPNYVNPVQSADTYSSSLTSQRGQDVQQQIAQMNAEAQRQAAQSAMYGQLFAGVGSAAGGALGAGGMFGKKIATGG